MKQHNIRINVDMYKKLLEHYINIGNIKKAMLYLQAAEEHEILDSNTQMESQSIEMVGQQKRVKELIKILTNPKLNDQYEKVCICIIYRNCKIVNACFVMLFADSNCFALCVYCVFLIVFRISEYHRTFNFTRYDLQYRTYDRYATMCTTITECNIIATNYR